MRNFMLLLSMMLFSILSHASIDRYHCAVVNERDVKQLTSLELKHFKNKILTVSFKACRLTKGNAQFDICKVQGHRLVIAVNPTNSVFLSKVGRAYEFSCIEGEKEDERDGGEQPQQQQQQQQQENDPGHGGSNIRMRGIVRDHHYR